MKELIRHILREHTSEIGEQKTPGKKLNTDEFIKRATEIHGGEYDYSKVNYVNYNTPVEIICSKHGPFLQRPGVHLRGGKCNKCVGGVKLDTKQFIEKADNLFDGYYDFSNSKYTNAKGTIEFVCPEHGLVKQRAGHILQGHGCPKCGIQKRNVNNKRTEEEFKELAGKIHNNEYDYSKVEYINSHLPVKIICPEHGEFSQTPSAHLNGQGCKKCGIEKSASSNRRSNQEFIKTSKEIHGDKYDYSKVNYVNSDTPVEIICKKHQVSFFPSPGNHIGQKTGCPICKESKGENLINQILERYEIKNIRQKRFADCTNQAKTGRCVTLPFDFYLPRLNTIIEYDGQQHYVPVWGEDAFKRLQRLDKIRNQYCEKNGIKLIRIPYTMKKEEIEPYILKELGIK